MSVLPFIEDCKFTCSCTPASVSWKERGGLGGRFYTNWVKISFRGVLTSPGKCHAFSGSESLDPDHLPQMIREIRLFIDGLRSEIEFSIFHGNAKGKNFILAEKSESHLHRDGVKSVRQVNLEVEVSPSVMIDILRQLLTALTAHKKPLIYPRRDPLPAPVASVSDSIGDVR